MTAKHARARALAAVDGFGLALGRIKLVALMAAVMSVAVAPAMANGGKLKTHWYRAEVPLAGAKKGLCRFAVEVQPVMFYLTTVQNKYQVVLIRVVNDTDKPLLLSKSKDMIRLRFGAKTVTGELVLSEKDSALWDSLPLKMRQALAYPPRVDRGEEEGVYLFIRKDALEDFAADRREPDEFLYSIDSLAKTVELRVVEEVSAH